MHITDLKSEGFATYPLVLARELGAVVAANLDNASHPDFREVALHILYLTQMSSATL